jgi:hypothetical protein
MQEEPAMETRLAYCATCDRPVRVLVKNEAPSWPSPQELDPNDIVCLEHGETCTGTMCPIFDVPSEEMKAKLAEYRRKAEEEAR